AGTQLGEHVRAPSRVEPGLRGEGEHRAALDTGRTRAQGLLHALGRPEASGEPERQPDGPHLRQVGLVARAEDRLTVVVQDETSPGRRVVTAGTRALDHEPV